MNIEYKTKGYCSFRLGDSLRKQTNDIPAGYGVYIFRKNTKDGDILYIGKSGTISQDGSFKAQDLRMRLNSKQGREQKRQDFLSKKLAEDTEIKQIFIEWYIIDERKYLPSLIEAQLLQDYYTQHSCLPIWNNEF